MKTVFISVPFKGRSNEDILKSIEMMHKRAEETFGEELKAVHNFFIHGESNEIICPKGSNKSMYYLSKAIEKMSMCDYFIGLTPQEISHGCEIETKIATYYNMTCIFVDISEVM